MDQNDPEKRFTDLEQRRFVAYAVPDVRRAYFTLGLICVSFLVVFGVLAILLYVTPNILDPVYRLIVAFAMMVGLGVVCILALRRLYWKRLVLFVKADGLTVDGRPGDVFPLRDAQLGQWTGRQYSSGPESAGRALFLTYGSDRFVVGASDGRVAGSMPSDGPQERYARLGARMSPQLFDELLAIVGPYRRTTNQ